MHVPGEGGMLLLLLGTGSGRLQVGGGQVFMLEILYNLLGQLRQHSFGQSLFCCLQGPGHGREERKQRLMNRDWEGHGAQTAVTAGYRGQILG